ncbi:membrane protein, putative [Candidatus Nitrosopelagicus brevis]|nr:membrane protein, putative [Candidatus Nitrosopelagicus brevis]|tara:strand:+ start:447 stop:1580 length:1134 start_codon:yes stop_codon:yes gene_type:complete
MFPALIISNTYEFSNDLDPFESNSWLPSIIISISSFLIIGFLYQKKKLPSFFQSGIHFILNFETSKRVSIITAIIILVIYIGFSSEELFIDEMRQWPDYKVLQQALDIWPSTDHWSIYVSEQNTRYVRIILLDFSQEFLQNIKLLPFVGSILVVVFTALITTQIAKKRFAGLVSMIILLQSITFTDFDTIAVYENFWVLFYLISLYSIQKRWWSASPVSFVLAIFTKAFIITYFWMNIFFIYRAEIPRKTKYFLFLTYGAVIGIVYWIFESGKSIIYDDIVKLDVNAFYDGFTGWGNNMQLDPLAILCVVPLTVGLFIKSLKGVKQADSVLILIMGTILAAPLISFVTDFYFILPYRYIPFIVAMAIGIGVFLSKED